MNSDLSIKQVLENAWSERRAGNYTKARNLVNEARERCNEDDYNSLGRIFHIYMQFEADHDNYTLALEFCQKSILYFQKAENSDSIAHSTRHLADIQRSLGNYTQSENNYRKAINIYRDNPATKIGDLANALRGYALVLEKRNKISAAKTIWVETKKLYQTCNLQAGIEEANKRIDLLSG